MAEFEHLFPKNTATPESYKYPHRVSSAEFKLPPRDDRVGHGQELAKQALAAEHEVKEHAKELPEEKRPKGVVLDFQGAKVSATNGTVGLLWARGLICA